MGLLPFFPTQPNTQQHYNRRLPDPPKPDPWLDDLDLLAAAPVLDLARLYAQRVHCQYVVHHNVRYDTFAYVLVPCMFPAAFHIANPQPIRGLEHFDPSTPLFPQIAGVMPLSTHGPKQKGPVKALPLARA